MTKHESKKRLVITDYGLQPCRAAAIPNSTQLRRATGKRRQQKNSPQKHAKKMKPSRTETNIPNQTLSSSYSYLYWNKQKNAKMPKCQNEKMKKKRILRIYIFLRVFFSRIFCVYSLLVFSQQQNAPTARRTGGLLVRDLAKNENTKIRKKRKRAYNIYNQLSHFCVTFCAQTTQEKVRYQISLPPHPPPPP